MKTYKEFNERVEETLIYYFKGFVYDGKNKEENNTNAFIHKIYQYIKLLDNSSIKYLFCYDNINKFIIYCVPSNKIQKELVENYHFKISRYQSFKSFLEFEKYITNTLHHKVIKIDDIINIINN